VLSSLKPNPHTYATSLMTVVEFLASPVIRPPAMASEISSGGFLERRFRMIIANNPTARTPRWLIAGVLLAALTLLPLGVAFAQGAGQDRSERIAWALHEAGVDRLVIRDVMGAMERVVHEIKAEGEDFELDPRLREHLVSRLELTDEQIELVIGLSRHVATANGDDDGRSRVIQVLMENGIAREDVEGVTGVLRHIAGEIHRQGDAFELHPGVRERLVHMNLTDEQIDLVVRLGHRRASAR
jgi:hypothetical protein